MKKLLKFLSLALMMGSSVAYLSSCDKKAEDVVNPDSPSITEKLTPTEAKEHLDQSAKEFVSLFRPADQKDLIELASWFDSEYADLSLPDEFEFEDEANPRSLIKALGQAGRMNVAAAASAPIVYTYNVNFDKVRGVYEAQGYYWVKVADSDDIVFRFKNHQGGDAELSVKYGGNVSRIDFVEYDWDYEYDWETDSYEEYEYEYQYNIAIPRQVSYTLVSGGKTLASGAVESAIDIEGHSFALKANISIANISGNVEAKGSDSKVEQKSSLKVGDVVANSSSAVLNGSNLLNQNHWESLDNTDSDEEYFSMLSKTLSSASVEVDMYGRVQFKAKVNDFTKEVLEATGAYYSSYEYSDREEAEKACQKDCDLLNKAFETSFHFNSNTTQGQIVFQPYCDEWGYGDWEYYPEPVLKFAADGTTYSFEEYFEDGFPNVESQFESILDNYERIWDNIK